MDKKRFSVKFIASQIAGSCRLAGVSVSAEDEKLMRGIISKGNDAKKLRRDLVEHYKSQNRDK